MFFNKSKQENIVKEENIEKEGIKVETEMIWIDGFKGTDKNMKCRDFQYEIGREFTYKGETNLCNSGFHACGDLNDVFKYYDLNGENRFFKIKAFVPEDYNKEFNKCVMNYASFGMNDTKFVTSKIKLVSECTYDDLKGFILRKYPMIETEDEFKNHVTSYDIFSRNKFINKMIELGYSESFAMAISNDSKSYIDILSYARAFQDENISKD